MHTSWVYVQYQQVALVRLSVLICSRTCLTRGTNRRLETDGRAAPEHPEARPRKLLPVLPVPPQRTAARLPAHSCRQHRITSHARRTRRIHPAPVPTRDPAKQPVDCRRPSISLSISSAVSTHPGTTIGTFRRRRHNHRHNHQRQRGACSLHRPNTTPQQAGPRVRGETGTGIVKPGIGSKHQSWSQRLFLGSWPTHQSCHSPEPGLSGEIPA